MHIVRLLGMLNLIKIEPDLATFVLNMQSKFSLFYEKHIKNHVIDHQSHKQNFVIRRILRKIMTLSFI